MEFPDLGQHCDDPTCKQLDFLPMKCDSCTKTFCKDHFPYDIHGCPEAYRKNFQVPVCPLCNEPVPFKRGEVPDICVSQHLDRDCRSDRRRKIYNNRCNKKGCKTKELVKITCDGCRLTFCLKHRLEVDHDCKAAGRPSPAASMAAAAAINRLQPSQNSNQSRITSFMTSSTSRNTVAASNPRSMGSTRVLSTSHPPPISRPPPGLQPQGLSEDEALAQAMSLSLQDSQPSTAIEPNANTPSLTEDEMLARAIAASEEEERARQRRNGNSNNSSSNSNVEDSRANCAIS